MQLTKGLTVCNDRVNSYYHVKKKKNWQAKEYVRAHSETIDKPSVKREVLRCPPTTQGNL
jgi:hypothetical protein